MYTPKLDEEIYSIIGSQDQNATPERYLLAAILERAILDYVGNDENEVNSAEEWLFGWQDEVTFKSGEDQKDNSLKEFSFRWVCHYLDLNPFKVANFIKSMPKRGSKRIAPWYFNKEELHGERAFASIR